MRLHYILLLPILLSSCGQAHLNNSSRFEGTPLSLAAQPVQVNKQVVALTELSRRIVMQTTVKSAGIGAAVGCGLAAVSSGHAKNCVSAAATGALGGAVVGHINGKRKVARQVNTVSPSAVVRALRETNDQMARVSSSLPARLAAQEDVLAQLELQRAAGSIDAQAYTAARAQIAAERRALAAALLETEGNAAKAASNMQAAQMAGQTGLDWHILNASNVAKEAHSARSNITLL